MTFTNGQITELIAKARGWASNSPLGKIAACPYRAARGEQK